jgi:hypothetical protein
MQLNDTKPRNHSTPALHISTAAQCTPTAQQYGVRGKRRTPIATTHTKIATTQTHCAHADSPNKMGVAQHACVPRPAIAMETRSNTNETQAKLVASRPGPPPRNGDGPGYVYVLAARNRAPGTWVANTESVVVVCRTQPLANWRSSDAAMAWCPASPRAVVALPQLVPPARAAVTVSPDAPC